MFRRKFQSNGGGGLPTSGLPTSSGGGGGGSSSIFNLGGTGSSVDGSARSIHLQAPVVTKWNRSSRAVKTSYMVTLVSFFVIIFGWRSLSYYHAKVHVECNTVTCTVTARGVGGKPVKVADIPRHQLTGAKPVKVNAKGVVVKHDVNLNEEWKYEVNKKKKSSANNYKGPDKDGNFLTYVVMMNNRDPSEETKQKESNTNPDQPQFDEYGELINVKKEEDRPPSVDLSALFPFMVRSDNSQDRHAFYIVLRQHGMAQARRRVRSMVQKVDSYAKRRRHKLNLKESTSPDWKAVLMLVLGGCVFLLSLLLALFWEEDEALGHQPAGGPGARRRNPQHHQPSRQSQRQIKSAMNKNPYQRAMPSRYEVSTAPKTMSNSMNSSNVRRRN